MLETSTAAVTTDFVGKSAWCRLLLPKLPSQLSTFIEFYEDIAYIRTLWNGIQEKHTLFQVIPNCSHADVYVNSNHPWTSTILGCNTNVQVGLGSKHIMFCTLYTGKSTEVQDSERYMRVAKSLVPL